MTHVGGGGRIEVGVLAHRQDLADLHIVEFETSLGQRGQQCRRFADPRGHDDEITILHAADRVGRGHPPLEIHGLEGGSHEPWWTIPGCLSSDARGIRLGMLGCANGAALNGMI